MNDDPQVGQCSGARMVRGWRRFFTRAYWRVQWACIRRGGRPVNIVSVGRLEVPGFDEE